MVVVAVMMMTTTMQVMMMMMMMMLIMMMMVMMKTINIIIAVATIITTTAAAAPTAAAATTTTAAAGAAAAAAATTTTTTISITIIIIIIIISSTVASMNNISTNEPSAPSASLTAANLSRLGQHPSSGQQTLLNVVIILFISFKTDHLTQTSDDSLLNLVRYTLTLGCVGQQKTDKLHLSKRGHVPGSAVLRTPSQTLWNTLPGNL